MQAGRQVPLMFSELTAQDGFGWFTDETVAADIQTLALPGREVTADLWDRSLLDAVRDLTHQVTAALQTSVPDRPFAAQ